MKTKYTLINRQGKVRCFYVLAAAELFHLLEGGVLIVDKLYAEAYAELLAD